MEKKKWRGGREEIGGEDESVDVMCVCFDISFLLVYACVYICVRVHACAYMNMYIYSYVYVYIDLYTYVYIYRSIFKFMCEYMYIHIDRDDISYTDVSSHVCVCERESLCVYVCV